MFTATRRILTTVAVALTVSAAPAHAGAAVKVFPLFDPNAAAAESRPDAVQFFMTGGDWMRQLHWGRWGAKTATATGSYFTRVCEPDCASGYSKKARGRLTLWRPVTCDGERIFTRARAQKFAGGRWRTTRNLGQPLNPCA